MPGTEEPTEGPSGATSEGEIWEIWAAYARDRFESIAGRVDEVRNRARQLIAVVGVLIGLEVNLVARAFLDDGVELGYLDLWSLLFLVVALAMQTWLVFHLVGIGFRGRSIREPERPSVLVHYLAGQDAAEARRVIGAYYAKSHDEFFELSEMLGGKVGTSTVTLARSLLLFLLGVLTLVIDAAV